MYKVAIKKSKDAEPFLKVSDWRMVEFETHLRDVPAVKDRRYVEFGFASRDTMVENKLTLKPEKDENQERMQRLVQSEPVPQQ